MVDFIQHDIIQMAYFILQPSFVYGPKLFQQDHGILFDSIDSGINLILDVIAAQITVGLCLFPTLF